MDLLKPFGSRSFYVGLGVAALAYLLAPTLKQNARAVAVKGVQGAMLAGGAASNALARGREKMSHVMHDVRENVTDNKMVEQLVSELKAEREQYANTLQEIMSTMKSMQEEIASLRGNEGTV